MTFLYTCSYKTCVQFKSEIPKLKHLCLFHSDTKTTQWEDPRLQSPAITGPVSRFLFSTHFMEFLLQQRLRSTQSYLTHSTLSFSIKEINHFVTAVLTRTLSLICLIKDKDFMFHFKYCFHRQFFYPFITVLHVKLIYNHFCAGCSLLQRVQTEI